MKTLITLITILCFNTVYSQHIFGIKKSVFLETIKTDIIDGGSINMMGIFYKLPLSNYHLVFSLDYQDVESKIDVNYNKYDFTNFIIGTGVETNIWSDFKVEAGLSSRFTKVLRIQKHSFTEGQLFSTPLPPESDVLTLNFAFYQKLSYQPIIFNNYGIILSIENSNYFLPIVISNETHSVKKDHIHEPNSFYLNLGFVYKFE